MKTYVLAKDESELRVLAVYGLEDEDVDAARAEQKRLSRRGCETELILGTSLQDVMRSFPTWFEEA